MDRRIVSFGDDRIRELKQVITHAQAEIEMWAHLIDQQKLCKTCKGETKTLFQVAQDESEWEECRTCKGTGKA